MKLVTVAGPPSCGKTSILLWAIEHLKAEGLLCGLAKFDCLTNQDAEKYRARGICAVSGISGGQCPDHYFATNVESAFRWGLEQGFDCLITESAGLCNRCSPYIDGALSVCVLDNLAGMGAPAKIGPLLRCADVVVITKGDIVSQAEREVFAFRVQQLAPRALVIHANGISGQGVLLLAKRMASCGDLEDISGACLRYSMPSSVCSFCIGETRVGRRFQTGNVVSMFGDDLPPLVLPPFAAEPESNGGDVRQLMERGRP